MELSYLLAALYFGVTLAALVLFSVCLYRFLAARKANQTAPDTFGPADMQKRKIYLIASGAVAGVFLLVVAAIAVILSMAVAFM